MSKRAAENSRLFDELGLIESVYDFAKTRSQSLIGVTQTCHLLQRLALIKYVLRNLYGDCIDEINIGEYIKNISTLISSDPKYATPVFKGQEGTIADFIRANVPEQAEDIIKKLTQLNEIITKRLTGHFKKLKPEIGGSDEDWSQAINEIWDLSEKVPLSIDFVNTSHDENTTGGLFASVHSFTLYKGCIYSGWADDKFGVPLKITPINIDKFKEFLRILTYTSGIYNEFGESQLEDLDAEQLKIRSQNVEAFKSFFYTYFFANAVARPGGPKSHQQLDDELNAVFTNYWTNRRNYNLYLLVADDFGDEFTTEAENLKYILQSLGQFMPTLQCKRKSSLGGKRKTKKSKRKTKKQRRKTKKHSKK
jgi:hypothetical protein